MHINRALRAFVLAAVVAAPFVATGCNSAEQPSEEAATSGSLRLPLLTTAASGTQYRLSQASFTIFGDQGVVELDLTGDPNDTVFTTTLATGNYSMFLNTFQLERGNAGVFEPVEAIPLNTFASFTILNGTTTTVSFQFQVDTSVVTIGEGNLNVAIEVDEFSGFCTPFSNECFFFNDWCVPGELLGRPSECATGGFTDIGQPCSRPFECVANASCFDLGEGPVCAAICPATAFGEPCDTGGICEPAGTAYGICR